MQQYDGVHSALASLKRGGYKISHLDDWAGRVQRLALQLPRGLDGVEQDGGALLGLGRQVVARALGEARVLSTRGGDIGEHGLAALLLYVAMTRGERINCIERY